jgi:D-alanyl-D-alanine carboxypeptidase
VKPFFCKKLKKKISLLTEIVSIFCPMFYKTDKSKITTYSKRVNLNLGVRKMRHNLLRFSVLFLVIIFGNNISFAQTPPDISTPEAFLNYLSVNRNNVAMASFSLKSNGSIDYREPIIALNIDTKMPLESLGKVIHLAAYAKALSTGEIQSNRIVTAREWENYYLPGTDGGAHATALEDLGIPVNEFGFAVNPETPVTVDQMVRAMIRYSDNAVHDWLFANLSNQTFRAVIREGSLSGQDFPKYFLGNDLSYENHEIGLSTLENVQRLKRLTKLQYVALVNTLTAKFQDPVWRQAEFAFRLANAEQLGNPLALREGEPRLSTKGTVRDYATIMAGVVTGRFISADISATMRRFLEQSQALIAIEETENFTLFGEKVGGSSGGFITDASYSVPRFGDFAGKRRITVLFQRLIDFEITGQQLSPPFIPFKFESKVARERTFAKQVRRVFNGY